MIYLTESWINSKGKELSIDTEEEGGGREKVEGVHLGPGLPFLPYLTVPPHVHSAQSL